MNHFYRLAVWECIFNQPIRSVQTSTFLKRRIQNVKVESSSSNEWVKRHLNDPFGKLARFHNYRCRSAFKLLQIDEKHKILHPGQRVIDLGASPGSWTQVVVEKLKLQECGTSGGEGTVIAVDLQLMYPIRGATVLESMNFMDSSTQDQIAALLPRGAADVVLSDMAPKASGTKEIDCAAISALVYCSLRFCTRILVNNGVFLCKMWNYTTVSEMMKNMQLLFKQVKIVKPQASYADSSEIFLLCTGFKKQNKTLSSLQKSL